MRKLNLSNNMIQSLVDFPLNMPAEVTRSSIGVSALINLVHLDLSNNRLVALGGLERLVKLEHLNLSGNLVSSVLELPKLRVNIALVQLHMTGNPIAMKR